MNQLPLLLAEITVVFAVSLLGARLASKARAAVRHLILASAFGVALILPVATLVSPRITVEIAALPARNPEPVSAMPVVLPPAAPTAVTLPGIESSPVLSAVPPSAAARSIPFTSWLLLAWGIVALVALLPVAASLNHLRSIRRRSNPWPDGAARLEQLAYPPVGRHPAVLLNERITAPITGGLFHPIIALPTDAVTWSDSHLANALRHELEHVRRHDWAVHLATRAVCALYWFHPLAWIAWRALRLEAERACDDAVLAQEDAVTYADQLLALARGLKDRSAQPGIPMVSGSDLSSRIRSVLDSTLPRGRAGKIVMACVLIVAAIAIAALASLRTTGPTRLNAGDVATVPAATAAGSATDPQSPAASAEPGQRLPLQAVNETSGDPATIAAIDAMLATTDRDADRYRRTEHNADDYAAESGSLVGLHDGANLRKLSAYLKGHNGALTQHMYFAADQLVFVDSIYDEYETKSRIDHRVYLSADRPIRRVRTISEPSPSDGILEWDPLPELLGRVKEFATCALSSATFCVEGVGAVDAGKVAFGYTDETGTRLLALPDDDIPLNATDAATMVAAVCGEGQVLPLRFLRMQQRSSASNGRQGASNFANEGGPLFEIVTGRAGASDTCMLVPDKYLKAYRVSPNEFPKVEREKRVSAYWSAVGAADNRQQPVDLAPFHAPTDFARKNLGALEKAKNRSVKLYWLLYRGRPEQEVAAVEFTPDDDNLLGSLVLVESGRLSFLDMPASLKKGRKDGGCWRVDDDCRFGAASMNVQAVLGSAGRQLVIVTLGGAEGEVILLLQPRDGVLVELKRAYRYEAPI